MSTQESYSCGTPNPIVQTQYHYLYSLAWQDYPRAAACEGIGRIGTNIIRALCAPSLKRVALEACEGPCFSAPTWTVVVAWLHHAPCPRCPQSSRVEVSKSGKQGCHCQGILKGKERHASTSPRTNSTRGSRRVATSRAYREGPSILNEHVRKGADLQTPFAYVTGLTP